MKIYNDLIPLCLLISLFTHNLAAGTVAGIREFEILQEDSSATAGENTAQISPHQKRLSFTGFPVVLYMPETSVLFGGGATITIRNHDTKGDERPDIVNFKGIYTLKKQIIFSLSTELYFDDYKWKIKPILAYQKFPDTFYGIGNQNSEEDAENYTTDDFLFYTRVTYRLYKNLSFGIGYDLKKTSVLKIEDSGLLAGGGYKGLDGSLLTGIGPVIEWDSRDNVFYPSKGCWFQFYSFYYKSWMGGNFSFDSYTLDLRYYLSLADAHVLAFQVLGKTVTGELPFNEYARLEMMRGLNGSRFRGRKMFFVQVEYRYPIHKRFSGVAFCAVGDVMGAAAEYELNSIKFGFGVGLRYLINLEEKINFRFDVGFSPWGVSPYFQISEAF